MSKIVGRRSSAFSKRPSVRQWMKYFPLKTIDAVVEFVEAQIATSDPDLVCLSLVLGALEVRMVAEAATSTENAVAFPQLNFAEIESLYQRFVAVLRQNIPANDIPSCRSSSTVLSTSEVVHKVSNVIWSCLSASYHKERAHIQSVYSLLAGWLMS